MALKLNDSFIKNFVSDDEIRAMVPELKTAYNFVKEENGLGHDFLGWKNLPVNYDRTEFAAIKAAAKKIQKSCDVFVVIGIGGSYLGARAAIEFVRSPLYNNLCKDTPAVYFTGNSISASAMAELLQICEGKDVCVNVISKSGTTTEPAVAFRIFRELIEKKYGEDGAKDRIFVTTDRARGKLKELASEKGYETFVVPDDIGGRYSVLTAVGLLPIAVAGIDIDDMMAGAAEAREAYTSLDVDKNDCFKYAVLRNILYRRGMGTEIFAAYDPALALTAEWWKQLYGESEGKDNKGIFPTSVIFSTDLHSLGQIIQEGRRNIFETVIDIKTANDEVKVPNDPANVDGLNFLAGESMHDICHTAFTATAMAHNDGGVPNIILEMDRRDAHNFGFFVYFFELACAISGYILGVNPFNQPGVEAYKLNMYALLGKPGYEDKRAELMARMGR